MLLKTDSKVTLVYLNVKADTDLDFFCRDFGGKFYFSFGL